jgi:hypothetical protein
LFKVATQGVSLWHFNVYLYIIQPELVHLLYFSSFYLSLLFMVAWKNLKLLYSFLYREYIMYVHLLNFFLLPSLTCMWPLLSMTCFS